MEDLPSMLKAKGTWVELGGPDEKKPAKEGRVEAWTRSPRNPIGGWYGLKWALAGASVSMSPFDGGTRTM
jgi:hypothetical protein